MQFCKQLRFEELKDDRTRLHLRFRYRPLAGALGHAAASLLGVDPKSLLTDLLMRAKFFLETGREPHDAIGRGRHCQSAEKGHSDGKDQGAEKTNATSTSSDGSSPSGSDSSLPAVNRGPGAPAGDVHRPGVTASSAAGSWPATTPPTPQPSGAAGRFPPAV
jgi:hypothetical protein